MANWSNPQLTSTYTNFVTEVKDRDVDLALQFDGTTSTNLPTGTIRWSSSANRWQKWSGSSWGELTNTYQLPNITISGVTNAGTLFAGTADITAEITCGRVDVDSSSVAANGMYLPSTNTLGFATGGTPHYYIDSSGNLLYGRSTARTDVSGRLQLEGTGSTSANILLARNQNISVATATLNFVKNHAASTTNTALPALSYLGQIGFWGANGTSYVRGVTIYAYADGAWSGSVNPTGINIDTTGGGRISLGSTGNFTLFNFNTNNTPVNLNGSAPNNALVLDASGNLGLGVVPKAWGASFNVLDFAGASFASNTAGTATFIAQNAYYDSAWKYKSSTNATLFQTDSGSFQWYTSTNTPSTNGAITFTQAMTLDASGNLGVGSTSISPAYGYSRVIEVAGGFPGIKFAPSGASTFGFQIGAGTGGFQFYDVAAATERARIDSSGRLLVGTGLAPAGSVALAQVQGYVGNTAGVGVIEIKRGLTVPASTDEIGRIDFSSSNSEPGGRISVFRDGGTWTTGSSYPGRLVFSTTADGAASPTPRMRIDSAGRVLIGTTDTLLLNNVTTGEGCVLEPSGGLQLARSGDSCLYINRLASDGELVRFYQDGNQEGTISVSGSTVSYNGAHLSRWSQLPGGATRKEILRGTVLSNIDEMCEWGDEDNEQLNRMKISDVEGDKNVAGVFQGWDDDDDTYTNDFYCAMTGDFIIRIGAGVTVERGDLLMSAGDGTAKPQDDDIIRSKTIAKVTSTTVSCTYDDGSYCVPCVLMAC